ncbi:MAG: hypothetical protein K2M51_00050, partial [Helicobacter sp.]|nr:hypothetical protein [Helicobacter sp.]
PVGRARLCFGRGGGAGQTPLCPTSPPKTSPTSRAAIALLLVIFVEVDLLHSGFAPAPATSQTQSVPLPTARKIEWKCRKRAY